MGGAAERSAREHIALSSNSARDKLATKSHLIGYKVNRKGDQGEWQCNANLMLFTKAFPPYEEQTGVVKAPEV